MIYYIINFLINQFKSSVPPEFWLTWASGTLTPTSRLDYPRFWSFFVLSYASHSSWEDFARLRAIGVRDGARSRNIRSHSAALYQLSYSHHREFLSQNSQPPLVSKLQGTLSEHCTLLFAICISRLPPRHLITASPRVWRFLKVRMASIHGFKPPSAFNSARQHLEQYTRVELVISAWQADVLPLN